MKTAAFELGEDLDKRRIFYHLHKPIWEREDLTDVDTDFSNWETIKYLNDQGDDFHEDVDDLPNDEGGLYLFFIRCPIMPSLTDYPVYIGRAKSTEHQNLRKRCREYFTKWAREDGRPKIKKMINYWGPSLYLSYQILENNDDIIDHEEKLINSLLLPFNDEVPDKQIKAARKAFQQ